MNSKDYRFVLLAKLKRYKGYLISSLLFTFASVGIYLLLPGWSIDLINNKIPKQEIGPIFQHLLVGLAIFVGGGVCAFGRAYTTSNLVHRITCEMRMEIFDHMLHISPRQAHASSNGDMLSRVSNDIFLFQGSVSSVVSSLIPSVILSFCFLCAMAWRSAALFVCVLFVLAPLVLVTGYFSRKLYVFAHRAQEILARIVSRFEEAAAGSREIKSFGLESRLTDRFERLNADSLAIDIARDRMDAIQPIVLSITLALGVVVLLLASVFLIGRAWISWTELTEFMVLLLMAYSPIQDASFSATRLMQLKVVTERFNELFAVERERDGPTALVSGRLSGEIKFEGVQFAYAGRDFRIDHLDLDIPRGQIVAVVGPSGAGKSTLLDLIPRFLAPQAGRVLIDGVDLRDYRLSDLRKEIGFVAQEPILFEATLLENLRIGSPDASFDEVREAAIAANVDEFAQKLPGGYEARMDFRGRNLSVGQRQRIALARVFLKKPGILLLDEPTSALDARSEDLVRKAVRRAARGRTTFIVAHRMSTVRDVDRILVMENGRIVEDGTHESLYGLNGIYRAFYDAQMSTTEAPALS